MPRETMPFIGTWNRQRKRREIFHLLYYQRNDLPGGLKQKQLIAGELFTCSGFARLHQFLERTTYIVA